MRKLILPFLLVSVGLVSCKKETTDISEINQGNQFYRTEIGKYIIYNYDSTIYDDLLGEAFPYQGQVRYTTKDTFRDNQGRLSYRVVVEKRRNDTDPFLPNDVITVTPAADHVEVYQKNLRFIKMTFPVSNGKSWNGNAMIPLDDQDYKEEYDNDKWVYTYSDFDTDFDPGNNLYEHTVTVNQIDDALNNPDVDSTAYAYRNFSKEVYAYGVGMIYRERTFWTFQPKVGSSGGSGHRKGYGVVMKAVSNN
ncbi:MAG: hypothetical protein EOO01_03705 [Chitinophagaceae bacterium]|nr:MAG: hypothetical protein EOO01_03705 [Chitinophagaceae bacterium]